MIEDKPIVRLKLGQMVTYSNVLERTTTEDKIHRYRVWVSIPQQGSGIVVQLKCVCDGRLSFESDYNEYNGTTAHWCEFKRTKTHRVAVVAFDIHRSPVLVPIAALEVTE